MCLGFSGCEAGFLFVAEKSRGEAMRRVSISWKTAQALLAEYRGTLESQSQAWAALEAAVREPVKRSVVASRVRKTAKRATKKERTTAVWDAVMGRAAGRCECCARVFTDFNVRTLDHFFGKKHVKESVSNCWALGWTCCHRDKTDNRPTRRAWQEYFVRHARKYGYRKEAAEVEREWDAEADVSRAASMTRGATDNG